MNLKNLANVLPLFVFTVVVTLGACASKLESSPGLPAQVDAALANPASQNCEMQGGRLTIKNDPSGGEYGVCIFEDNMQCEEWALLRGDCPAGGVKVTGYLSPAAAYCAITGGEYKAAGMSSNNQEPGTCTFASGKVCDVWEYFEGECTK